MNKKGFTGIEIILVVAILGLIGFVVWQNVDIKPKGETNETLTMSSPKTEASPVPTNSSNGWKTYTNEKHNFNIEYPPEWSSSYEEGGGGDTFKLEKNNYEITIFFPSGYGPGACIFSDSPDFNKDLSDNPIAAGSKCPGEYIVIKTSVTEMRRLSAPKQNGQGGVSWEILTKEEQSGWFVTVPPISYTAPTGYTQQELKEMDDILGTLEFN